MFRRYARLAKASRERILSLVLLPASFLGTLSHSACICADGHRELFCNAKACQTAQGCGDCCTSRRGQCCDSKQGCPADGQTAQSNCCQPVVEVPAPAVGSDKAKLPSPMVALLDTISPLAYGGSLATISASHSTPPPLDLVIVLRHLTI